MLYQLLIITFYCMILSFGSFGSFGRKRKREPNCYDKLGISTDALPYVIKKTFRKLAMEYHPDKFVGNPTEKKKAQKIFQELAACYEILSDEEQRKKYDASDYDEQFASQAGGHFQQGNFDDIFRTFFGGGSGSSGHPFGGGGGHPFGSGGFHQQQFHGRPQHEHMHGQHHQHQAKMQSKTVYVDLDDLVDDSFKSVSNQRGQRDEIKIPKGCPDGHKIQQNGMEYVVQTKKHELFVRGERSHKSDLYVTVDITLEQALFGFDLEMTSIDSEFIQEHIEEIPHSKQFQIKRMGLPRYEGKTRGHLYVDFHVLLPTLSEDQRTNLKEYINDEWDYSDALKYRRKQIEKERKRNKRRNKAEL